MWWTWIRARPQSGNRQPRSRRTTARRTRAGSDLNALPGHGRVDLGAGRSLRVHDVEIALEFTVWRHETGKISEPQAERIVRNLLKIRLQLENREDRRNVR